MKRLILILFVFLSHTAYTQSCKNLPRSFSTYNKAINLVKSSEFKFTEFANTSNSSWITSAKYYSCDGNSGYFIYTTNRGYEYIHKGVPKPIWDGFKNASSKGSYYDRYIKGNYQLPLQ